MTKLVQPPLELNRPTKSVAPRNKTSKDIVRAGTCAPAATAGTPTSAQRNGMATSPNDLARSALAEDVLLAAFHTGDVQASRIFVQRYQRTVFGVALSVVGVGLAEDVAQEAFVRIWRYAGSYDPRRGTVRSWVVRITHNLAVDTLRINRRAGIAPEDLIRLVASGESNPEQSAVAAETAREFRRSLWSLPPAQARAVVMAGVHGLTAQQIAEIEGIPVGTVKSRVRAGMLKLCAARAADLVARTNPDRLPTHRSSDDHRTRVCAAGTQADRHDGTTARWRSAPKSPGR